MDQWACPSDQRRCFQQFSALTDSNERCFSFCISESAPWLSPVLTRKTINPDQGAHCRLFNGPSLRCWNKDLQVVTSHLSIHTFKFFFFSNRHDNCNVATFRRHFTRRRIKNQAVVESLVRRNASGKPGKIICLLAEISPSPPRIRSHLHTRDGVCRRRLPLLLLDGLKVAVHNWHQWAELQSLRLLSLQRGNKEEVFAAK